MKTLQTILVITLITVLSSCKIQKEVNNQKCCTKKAAVDNCTKEAKKSECCKPR